ncbi:hypothetical protein EPUL_000150, partial [Erysiphe pulchra]
MTEQSPSTETPPKIESRSETHNSGVVSNITPLHAPLLEGWPPTTTHLYTPAPLAATITSVTVSAANSSQDNVQDVEMTDVIRGNDTTVNNNGSGASPSTTTEAEGLSSKATIKTEPITNNKGSNITIVLNTSTTREPNTTIAIGKSRNSTPSRAAAFDNSNNENTSNNRASNSQHVDTTTTTTAQVMPKEASPNGAPTRRYLNENVTGILLEGMKMIVKE